MSSAVTVPEIESLLMALPIWPHRAERRAFIDDLLWQLGQPDAVLGCAAQAEAAAGVAARCASGTPLQVLCDAIADRGLGSDDELPLPESMDASTRWTGSPFPGPRAFHLDEAPIFCGRGFEVGAVLRMLAAAGSRLSLIAGACGCGKTSLVQAGVLAALRRGGVPGLPGSDAWVTTIMRPASAGTDPVAALKVALGGVSGGGAAAPGRSRRGLDNLAELAAAALSGRPAGAKWLLVVDDLEELFAPVCATSRDGFLDLLCRIAEVPRVRVLATVRSDHLDACVEQPGLRAAINAGGLFTLALPPAAALARMIRAPLARLSSPVTLSPSEVDRLVAQTLGQPVPLLYLAGRLQALAAERGSAVIGPAAAAPSSDGPDGAAADSDTFFTARAARALERAGDRNGDGLPGLFARLVRIDAGSPRQLCIGAGEPLAAWNDDARAQRLIRELAATDIGLLDLDDGPAPRVRLAHAGLPDAWPRLRRWVADRLRAGELADQIRREASAWQTRGCPDRLRWSHELLAPTRRLLAETGLLGDLERDIAIADFLTPEAERLLAEVLCRDADDDRREDIGVRLARIGDPRPGVLPEDDCPRPRWCLIPAGRVLIDGRHEVDVAPFRLAAYPVTRAQFEVFLDAADGFDDPAWWQGLQRLPIGRGGHSRRGNDPATAVSWHDATAFCRWLSARLGRRVRLPDEAEWQWAAQSAEPGFVYPWGSDWLPACANTDEAGIGRCIAVGLYPDGQSRQGVYDLAGNTWEWCEGPFDRSGRQRGARVIRGGSWRVNRGFARADFRLDAMPEDRVGSTGFRLACDLDRD